MREDPHRPPSVPAEPRPGLADRVGAKAARKIRARRGGTPVWLGLGAMGLVGWSIVVPTLLGAALGMWLDEHHPGPHAWTLALLVAGLTLGCLAAWRWVAGEDRSMHAHDGDGDA